MPTNLPLIAVTLGDVAGVGPEVVVRACCDERLRSWCRPLVVGHPDVVRRAIDLVGCESSVVEIDSPAAASNERQIASSESPRAASRGKKQQELACWNPAGDAAAGVAPGRVDAVAGLAAFDYLLAAARAALAGEVDGIATAPLNKAALHLAGRRYPGHTEILAEACGVSRFAMMLYLPPDDGEHCFGPSGLCVAHVTLHTSIASVPGLLSTPAVEEKITLVDDFLRDVGCPAPRIAVCALNPHAGEEGLFGDEEQTIIAPAVAAQRERRIDVAGPLPADTLFCRAVAGEFDGVVAMYHDQGHIALKLLGSFGSDGRDRVVNVTLGLPIVRTSPSHGTAFDIAWQGRASADGMLEALRVAALLAQKRAGTIVR